MIETQEITIDYLKKLDIEKPMIPLTFDRLTKAFFEKYKNTPTEGMSSAGVFIIFLIR